MRCCRRRTFILANTEGEEELDWTHAVEAPCDHYQNNNIIGARGQQKKRPAKQLVQKVGPQKLHDENISWLEVKSMARNRDEWRALVEVLSSRAE